MLERVQQFFSTDYLPPHGYCFMWVPEIVWLHVVANALIAIAYFSIPLALWQFARKRQDIPFNRVFILFATFITLCGLTHVFGIAVLWWPAYGIEGLVMLATGLVSAATALFVWRILPNAMKLPSPTELEVINRQLNAAKVEIEQTVRERTAELEQANAELLFARQRADEANAAKSNFLANMSHEIRTPMNAVVGIADLLTRTGPLNEQQQQFVSTLQTSAAALLDLLNDLLDIEKIEADAIELEQIPFNIHQLVGDVAHVMSVRAQQKQLALRIDNQTDQSMFVGDPLRIRQVLMNLVSNSVKFTHQGEIVLGVAYSNEGSPQLRLTVADTGIGIPAEKQPQIFDQFVQADSSVSRQYGGSGLGLAIVKRLVALMGGDISLKSATGEGTTFTIALPLEGVDVQPQPRTTRMLAAGVKPRLLLVEDYDANILVATAFLDQMDLTYDIARDGPQALAKYREQPFDLVLLDLQLPGLDGFEVAQAIRLHESQHNLHPAYLIAATANVLTGEREQCLRAGMNDFLIKPYTCDQLEEKIVEATQAQA
jgi:signal transduction histidine kinase/ActR/RegA family two-component response regulator